MSCCENCEKLSAQLQRIEDKLDTFIKALAEEEQAADVTHDLEGNTYPGEREPGQSLD